MLQEDISTKNGEWTIKGFIDVLQNVYIISSDTKIISKILEIHYDYRKNEYIELLWNDFNIFTREHFYHVGGNEKNRNPMIEAIITNYSVLNHEYQSQIKPVQYSIFEA